MAGRITDDELARVRSKIGQRMTVQDAPYLTEVTTDAIRHWAEATGDRNPLFVDETYARDSVHGDLVAPPTMLYAFDKLAIGYRGGLPGVHSMFGGTNWEWLRPLRRGERIRAEVTFKDLVEHKSRFAGRTFQQISEIKYVSDAGETVARAEAWGMRTERETAKEKGKYRELSIQTYTPEDLEKIAAQYRAEQIRGREALYWDDVQVGDAVPAIVRGPYTATIAVAFEQAWGGLFIKAHGYWFDYLDRHPRAGVPNEFGVPEPPERVHWDTDYARAVGVPAAYDYGPERITWLATLLTNWIGDEGFLQKLAVQVRRFNLVGDTTWCRATVQSKSAAGPKRGRLELEVWAEDQRGDRTALGTATVELPRRVK